MLYRTILTPSSAVQGPIWPSPALSATRRDATLSMAMCACAAVAPMDRAYPSSRTSAQVA
jgi:hypothetical protein